jgi:hypothetical protein
LEHGLVHPVGVGIGLEPGINNNGLRRFPARKRLNHIIRAAGLEQGAGEANPEAVEDVAAGRDVPHGEAFEIHAELRAWHHDDAAQFVVEKHPPRAFLFLSFFLCICISLCCVSFARAVLCALACR